MELIRIKKHHLPQFASVLPEKILSYSEEIFACAEGGIPVGVIALEKLESSLGISWIWVEPKLRGHGIGTALLNKARQYAKKCGVSALTIAYEPDAAWAPVLEYQLARMGFQLLLFPLMHYCVTRKELQDSFLMRGVSIEKKQSHLIYALEELSPKELSKLLLQCKEQDNYLAARSDFSNADRRKTKLLIDKNRLEGLLLVNSTDRLGEYELAVMYLSPSYVNMGPAFFREAVAELLRDSCSFSVLHFTCVTETSAHLAEGLLKHMDKNVKQMCHGILELSTAD